MVIELSELELVWPPRLFAEEAQALLAAGMDSEATLGWLLEEAFHGDVGLRLYQQEDAKAPIMEGFAYNPLSGAAFGAPAPTRPIVTLVNDLAAASEGLPRHVPRRYYRARQTPVEASTPLSIAEVKWRFAAVVVELDSAGYFERAFGSSCVDDADDPDANGQEQLSMLLDENQTPGDDYLHLWPMRPRDWGEPAATWSDGLFYDLVEALHDLVARPRTRHWHDYGREWDYADFTRRPGQAVYRWRINELLDRSEVPLRLSEAGPDTGRLVTAAGDSRDDLMTRALESPEPKIQARTQRAVARFRDRHATAADKREAIRNLADVLEQRRDLLKRKLLRADESALFQIANQFEIRHLSEQQKSDYDESFLDWVFWWYLATVELTDRLLARQEDS